MECCDDENFNRLFGTFEGNIVDSFEENGERRSENVEKFGELSAGFNAQRSVSTGSYGIITKVSHAALVTIHECREWLRHASRFSSRAVALAKSWLKSPVGATCIFNLSLSLSRSLSLFLTRRTEKRLDPIQCSAKVLCNRSNLRAALAMKCFFRQCQSRNDRQIHLRQY